MTWRRTKKDIVARLGWINEFLAEQGCDQELTVEWCGATGRARALVDEGTVNLSPLLPTGEMVDWLFAYFAGLQRGVDLATPAPRLAIGVMTLDDLRDRVITDPEWAKANRYLIKSRLSAFAWDIGATWDGVDGIDPDKGPERRYGTRNRRSMTCKFRKTAGYSYP